MAAASQVVQDALVNEQTEQKIESISKKYGLSPDQSNTYSKVVYYMLLEYVSPEQAAAELTKTGLSQEEIGKILDITKQEIFTPIWDRLSKQETASLPQPIAGAKTVISIPTASVPPVPKPVVPPAPPVPKSSAATLPQVPRGTYAPPLQSPRYPGEPEEVSINQIARPAAPKAPQSPLPPGVIGQGQKFVPKNILAPKPLAPSAPVAPAPKVMSSSLRDAVQSALHNNEEGRSEPAPVEPRPVTPAAPSALQVPKPVAPTPPPPAPPTPPGLPPLTKSYAVDPYREPIE